MTSDASILIFGIAIFAGSLVGYLLWRRHASGELTRLRSSGAVAEATVTEVTGEGGAEGPGEIGVTYSFTPLNTNLSITKSEMLGILPSVVPKVGDRVRVRYDPKSPNMARLDLQSDNSAF
jgi:hypothetical protein